MERRRLELTPSDAGCLIRLRVTPGARQDRIVGPHGAALKLMVSAPPEKGRANEAVVRLLADRLGLRAAQVTVVAGLTGRDKVVRVEGISPEEIRAKLEA